MPQITLLVKWNYCTSTMDFRYILVNLQVVWDMDF